MADLVERLRAQKDVGDMMFIRLVPINPDGPEAADEIERLRASPLTTEREKLRELLYEKLCWFGGFPEPQGDVPERYHRWDDLGELSDAIAALIAGPVSEGERV